MRLILTILLTGLAGAAIAQDTPQSEPPELVGGSVRTNVAIAVPDLVEGQVLEVHGFLRARRYRQHEQEGQAHHW